MYNIQKLVEKSYQNSVNKGWYEKRSSNLERIALMASEIAEATEEVRLVKEDYYEVDGKPEGQSVELADVLIRIFDFAGASNINLSKYIQQQFFLDYQNLEYIHDIEQEVRQLNNIRCYNELENLKSDIEFHASFLISLGEAAKSIIKENEEKQYLFLAETIVKIIYFSFKKSWDIGSIIEKKHNYNTTRPHKHGGKTI